MIVFLMSLIHSRCDSSSKTYIYIVVGVVCGVVVIAAVISIIFILHRRRKTAIFDNLFWHTEKSRAVLASEMNTR